MVVGQRPQGAVELSGHTTLTFRLLLKTHWRLIQLGTTGPAPEEGQLPGDIRDANRAQATLSVAGKGQAPLAQQGRYFHNSHDPLLGSRGFH